ncbi:hypothetical protein HNR46_002545 [Haloferula luteola]|uniref:Uncharacterized protein n=1 Tax=Haloferula luteola TaxID=595692 RepID=A0A840V2T8_9BACT|nr:hypothetical protein [Haloferula luteola]
MPVQKEEDGTRASSPEFARSHPHLPVLWAPLSNPTRDTAPQPKVTMAMQDGFLCEEEREVISAIPPNPLEDPLFAKGLNPTDFAHSEKCASQLFHHRSTSLHCDPVTDLLDRILVTRFEKTRGGDAEILLPKEPHPARFPRSAIAGFWHPNGSEAHHHSLQSRPTGSISKFLEIFSLRELLPTHAVRKP